MVNYMTPEIQAGIFGGESGGDYDALYGFNNRSGGRFDDRRVSQMTLAQLDQFDQQEYGPWSEKQLGYRATPTGAYQVVGDTRRAAATALGLSPDTVYDKATQDRIGEWILQNQGTGAWEGYKGPGDPSKVNAMGNPMFPGDPTMSARNMPLGMGGPPLPNGPVPEYDPRQGMIRQLMGGNFRKSMGGMFSAEEGANPRLEAERFARKANSMDEIGNNISKSMRETNAPVSWAQVLAGVGSEAGEQIFGGASEGAQGQADTQLSQAMGQEMTPERMAQITALDPKFGRDLMMDERGYQQDLTKQDRGFEHDRTMQDDSQANQWGLQTNSQAFDREMNEDDQTFTTGRDEAGREHDRQIQDRGFEHEDERQMNDFRRDIIMADVNYKNDDKLQQSRLEASLAETMLTLESNGIDPTSLMQNIEAAGYKPGTPEYHQAMKDALAKEGDGLGLSVTYGPDGELKIVQGGSGATTPTTTGAAGGAGAPAVGADGKPVPTGTVIGVGKTDPGRITITDPNTGEIIEQPVKGSEDAAEAATVNANDAASAAAGRVAAERNLTTIGDIERLAENWTTTGLPGAILGNVPGTPAYTLKESISTLGANIGFDKLQEMRENSPNGAALGNVTEREIQFLQSVLGSINPNQESGQLKTNIARIRKAYEAVLSGDTSIYTDNELSAINEERKAKGQPPLERKAAGGAKEPKTQAEIDNYPPGTIYTLNGKTYKVD